MSRLFLTLVAGPGSLEDLRELYEPIRAYFTGLCAVYHGECDDPESRYLESAKGVGRIVYLPYVGRHDQSRNVALHCGAIEQGDWVMQCDTLERLVSDFVGTRVPDMMRRGRGPMGDEIPLNAFFYYSKPLLFEYHESLQYAGTPHEGLRRLDGKMHACELSVFIPDESKVRLNVRPLKRTDPYHWVGHYVRYYLATPWGANHCLLGNEHRGDPMKLYQEREALRIEVREYLRANGVPLTEAGLRKFLTAGEIPPTMRGYINRERILNDAYRYWVLNDLTVKDDHTWAGMVQIKLDPIPQAQ